MENESEHIRRFIAGSEEDFKVLFDAYYNPLLKITTQWVKDSVVAEGIVIDVFYNLWKVRESLDEQVNLPAYLMRSIRNASFNYLNSRYKRTEYPISSLAWNPFEKEDAFNSISDGSDSHPLGVLVGKESERKINDAIGNLPEKCGQVFKKSRFEGKTYAEISAEMGISVNTVKYHMKTALSLLAKELLD